MGPCRGASVRVSFVNCAQRGWPPGVLSAASVQKDAGDCGHAVAARL
jgi:hypothetical protein